MMKRFVSILIIVLLVLSSTVAFADNGKKVVVDTSSEVKYDNQLKQLEDLLKLYHENENQRKWLVDQLTYLKNNQHYSKKNSTLTIYLNGAEFNYDNSLLIEYRNVSLPVNLITKGLGAGLKYGNSSRTITITKGATKIVIGLSSKKIILNNKEIKPNILTNNKTNSTIQLIKFIAESLGHRVEIDEAHRTVTIEGNGNLASKKQASTDSELVCYGASMGNDENVLTKWCARDGGLNHWWKVDLGNFYDLTGSEVKWELNNKIYKYNIEVSTDNTNWMLIVNKSNNSNNCQTQKDNFSANSIRYVRISVTGLDTGCRASFYEFKVFGNLHVADAIAPSVPQCLTANTVSTTGINLKWSASSDSFGVAGYRVFRNGVQIAVLGNVTTYSDTALTAGTAYVYTVSAYDAAGNNSSQCAAISASTFASAGNGNGLRGEYYDNKDFSSLKLSRIDPTIDFNWGTGSPDPSIEKETFSIRWTGQILPLYSEEYCFHTISDDGVRLFINGKKIIDNWNDHSATENDGKIILVAGQKYDIRVDYYQNTVHSTVKLFWSSKTQPKQIVPQSQLFSVSSDTQAPTVPGGLTVSAATATQVNLIWSASADNIGVAGYKLYRNGIQIATVTNGITYNDTSLTAGTTYSYTAAAYDAAGNISQQCAAVNVTIIAPIGNGNGLRGEYYDNMNFTNLKVIRIDPVVDFNWGAASPDPSMGKETFSVRWSGQVLPLYSGEYTFYTNSDDGVRLWVNGVKVIDNWTNHGVTEDQGKITLTGGQKYDIKLNYFQNTGDTAIRLLWSNNSQTKQIIPQSQLFGSLEDTKAPTIPAGLTASSVSTTQINLKWDASTDNLAVAGYKIFRNGTQITTVTNGVTFNDTGLNSNTAYFYTVSAYDATGNNSQQCAAVNATTKAPAIVEINDNATGTGDGQFNYSPNWSYGSQPGAYMDDNHWSATAEAYYQVQFTGTQIKLYAAKAATHGIGTIFIDGTVAATIDFYTEVRTDNVLVYTSPVMQHGLHTLMVKVTGTKNNSSSNYYIPADRVEIIDG